MLSIFIPIFFHVLAQAESRLPNLKWDWEVREISRKYSQESYPTSNVDAWWADPNMNDKKGMTSVGVPKQYRHMHAMVVAAFYSRRKDHRGLAKKWLNGYECENVIACRDFEEFYGGALKANILNMGKKAERQSAESLRKKIQERAKRLGKKIPPTSGVCPLSADRKSWLELEYSLFCPPYKGVGTPDESRLIKEKIERDSHQMVMSSSFLESLIHKGDWDCSSPWKTTILCGGGTSVGYTFLCKKENDGHPVRVSCEETK